ncbi:hypothetical protein [Novosphingobium sp. HII-3]|uniref:hypothetical protein n=1 Tax=Novosphingobium sp. HII-3 TaxID=2075565 RepID=UPI0011AFB7C6|nr:hypothetical protein [Novosphingobium sp. HII-3]
MSGSVDAEWAAMVREAYAGGSTAREALARYVMSGGRLGDGEHEMLYRYGFIPQDTAIAEREQSITITDDMRPVVAHIIAEWRPPARKRARPVGSSVVPTSVSMLVGLDYLSAKPPHGTATDAKKDIADRYHVSTKTVEAWIAAAGRVIASVVEYYRWQSAAREAQGLAPLDEQEWPTSDEDLRGMALDGLRTMLGGSNS